MSKDELDFEADWRAYQDEKKFKEAPRPFGYRTRDEELNKALREAIDKPLPTIPRWQKLLIGLGSISFWLFFFWLLTIA